MKYVLCEMQLNELRFIKDMRQMQYTRDVKKACRYTYSKAHQLASVLGIYGWDFAAVPADTAEKLYERWHRG